METTTEQLMAGWENWRTDCPRIARAVEACWMITNVEIVLLDVDTEEGFVAAAPLMSLGLDVHAAIRRRPAEVRGQEQPVIAYHAVNRQSEVVRDRLEFALSQSPDSPICMITGFLPLRRQITRSHMPYYQDARGLLEAAGIGFVSFTEGETHHLHPPERLIDWEASFDPTAS